MFNKLVFILSAILLSAGITYAQYPCATDEHYRELLVQHPELAEYEKQFNTQLNAHMARTTASASDTITYDIPIVIHVIHDYGAEYVSDNDIFNAADYWAKVFMKQNADTISVIQPFKPHIGNPKIRLHLATIDPTGKPTKGVVRVQSYLTSKASDQAKYHSWPNNQYINIWLINAFGSSGAAAYAYYPSAGAGIPYYDGVISLYNYINVQKTIPHELGHVLNLSHTWGSTNNPGVACGDDNVDDTPPTLGHLPGCGPAAVYDTNCATGYVVPYVSSTGLLDSIVDYPDTVNSQNIMDYTYCELMFTNGQGVRMRNTLNNPTAGRNNLSTPANLAATGALAPRPDLKPIADFTLNRAQGAGTITDIRSYFLTFDNVGSFVFRNTSWNDTISDVQWTFSNGALTPTSTSTSSILNRFSVPGWVTVSLVANSNAGSDTLVNTQAVYAADTTPVGTMGYSQQFASPTDIINWPIFNYYNNQFKWEFYNGAGYDDNSCLRFRSFDSSARRYGTAVGDRDDIYTPAFNLTNTPDSLYLNFFTAGASTTSGIGGWTTKIGDSLVVEASTNGGAKWSKLAVYKGTDLSNNGNKANEFELSATAAWKPRAVQIPAIHRTGNTFFRFRYWPGNTGNNLYLDNFYLYQFPSGVKEAMAAQNLFNVFPNPSANGCSLVFKTGSDGTVHYFIKDLSGKTVYEQVKTFTPNTLQQEILPRAAAPSAGMYFITVVIDGTTMTQKLVVY